MNKDQLDTNLNKLTNGYNNSLTNLANSLKNTISIINSYRISKTVKLSIIDSITNNYNNAVKKLTTEYNNKKNALINMYSANNKNKKQALLIGINYINTPNELSGCINDTKNIKDMLFTKFNYNNFTFLTDYSYKKPTKKNIIDELTNLLVNSNSGDNIFFLYSGHGTNTIDLNGDETDGQDEMIVPLDATSINTCILDDELNKIIQVNLKKNVKLFMMFDSCFSGTVVDLKYNYLSDLNTPNINLKSSETIGQVYMISGCTNNQTSADAYVTYLNKNINSGAMTWSLLKTIEDLGTNISLKTLLENMRNILKQNDYQQVPQLSSGQSIDIETTMLQL
jgi:hypothetical protein